MAIVPIRVGLEPRLHGRVVVIRYGSELGRVVAAGRQYQPEESSEIAVWVRFGALKATAALRVTPAGVASEERHGFVSEGKDEVVPRDDWEKADVFVSAALARRLCMRLPSRVHALWDDMSNPPVLSLGPVVGVLVQGVLPFYRRYVQAAREQGVEAFLFSPRHVRRYRPVTWGYYPVPGGWRRRIFPFPNVVYDRFASPSGRKRWRLVIRRLRRFGCRTFNGGVGNKWSTYRRLCRYPSLRSCLPVTVPLRSTSTLLRMVNRHGGVFVKPFWGQQGRGIYCIRRRKAGGYIVRSWRGKAWLLPTAAVLARFARFLMRRRAYLVQPEIDLLRVGGSVWDVRVLTVRNAEGEWEVAGMAVRKSRRRRIVANLHRGGHPVGLIPFLERYVAATREEAEHIAAAIREVAVATARCIGRFSPRTGDLGIDVLLDRRRRPWVIEVNPKPGRRSFDLTGDPETLAAVYGLPFAYARYLAGFSGRS